jgi:antitoxin (DNA-binding transcriptional repressor) of toxin-antitoxin stability system
MNSRLPEFNSKFNFACMKTITMLQMRKKGAMILREVSAGETYQVSYRGKLMANLTPPQPARGKRPPKDDPIYRLAELAEPGGGSLTNEEIDKIVYGI